jgi:phosphoglycerate dehydrogenase-like enzyme
MMRILVENDHFLKILPAILDSRTPEEHRRGVADFFAHDVPDFPAWCESFRAQIPGLYPAEIQFAATQGDFDAGLADADMAIVEGFAVTAETLARAKRLFAVQKFGVVTNTIDLEAAQERRVAVLTQRRVVNIAVAEQIFAMLLALSKQIGELSGVVTADALIHAGYTIRPYDRRYTGASNYARIPALRTLHGATLGIVGLGEIGREVAAFANAFGMGVLYHQRSRIAPMDEMALGAKHVSLADLMAGSDYIVVQLPLNDSTRGLVGREALEVVKPGAILINAARAELIVRDALVEALQSGRLAGAGLDVGYAEPWAADDPLLAFKDGNVILMPHTAIGDRANGLEDMRALCVSLWRAMMRRR